MKKLILLLMLSGFASAQQSFNSYVTRNKDTLYLVNNELGKHVAGAWEGEFYKLERDGKKPYIVFVDASYIKKRYKTVKMKTTAKTAK